MATAWTAIAPGKAVSLNYSVGEVRQTQHSVLQRVTSNAMGAVCKENEGLQSRLAKFQQDAAFVEEIRTIRDDINR